MSKEEYLIRIAVGLIAGLLIGIEREAQSKSAGIKTNALVALGAAVFIILSLQYRGEEFVDITRVLGQVVIGVGFIGGGVILQHKGSILGLTTAATVWCSAAAGCMAGMGMFFELLFLVLFVLLINIFLEPLDKFIRGKFKENRKRTPD
ncbi:MgtC/SapB family protein [Salegentibacter sediminis]|uniref:MgtC/SapB family protein n=1 Tax=Salegentibacter sediminis TaxID=1930251 RepID=UPI0009BD462B|nr:MgtC/SapB family protein [Salegentibacter sediminis]